MKYLSVCSGIEAASVAWHSLGWEPLAFSEIEPFPRAVLAHHYPDVPLFGDFTKLCDEPLIEDADILVGGTPCQAFSVAGLRNSLADERGNLSLEFVRLADAIDDLRLSRGRPAGIIVWENVPGVLSVKDNAFGCFLAALAGDVTAYVPPRGKWTNAGVVDGPQRTVAWRVLDAQYFGLAQRRRRVFVVASARKGFDPAAVLLEFEGVRRDSPPRREARQGASAGVEFGPSGGRFTDVNPTLDTRAKDGPIRNQLAGAVLQSGWPVDIAPTLNASFGKKQGLENQHIRGGQDCLFPQLSMCLNAGAMGRCDAETETLIPTIGCVFDASEDNTGRGTPLVPVAFHPTQDPISSTDGSTHALGCGSKGGQASVAVTYPINTQIALRHEALGERTGLGIGSPDDPGFTLQAGHSHAVAVQASQSGVRVNDTVGTLDANYGSRRHNGVMQHMAVRRLTPTECERLQGFPDGYTMIPWKKKPAEECPDGPRYKALGNSMAVPCMAFIGRRIADKIKSAQQEQAA